MSKRKRRTRKKKTEEKPVEEEVATTDLLTAVGEEITKIEEKVLDEPSEAEKIITAAPELPWRFSKEYISIDFRKAYVDMLKKLVALHNLNYLVDQTAVLTPQ